MVCTFGVGLNGVSDLINKFPGFTHAVADVLIRLNIEVYNAGDYVEEVVTYYDIVYDVMFNLEQCETEEDIRELICQLNNYWFGGGTVDFGESGEIERRMIKTRNRVWRVE